MGAVAPTRPTSVLLADDDERFRSLVRSILEDDGYAVVAEVDNASAACDAARAHQPDVVVLDLVMEGSTGLSTVRQLMEDDPRQAILVISSLFDPVVEQEVVSLGAWYIEKVEGIEALERAIDHAASVTRLR